MATHGPFARGQLLRIECLYWVNQTKLALSPAAGDTTIRVRNASGYASPNPVVIDPGTDKEEFGVVQSVSGQVITLTAGLVYGHTAGAAVGELSDPTAATVALKIPGTGATAAPTVTAESTGRWAGTYAVPDAATSHGLWEGRTLATGAVQAADQTAFSVEVGPW